MMLRQVFRKPQKWSVFREMLFREIEDLGLKSLGIIAFISFFVGGVIAIQTALNVNNPFIPKYLIGFATKQSMILEFAPTFMSVILAGKVGSYISSSIGTMRVTEQIDALEVMGINSLNVKNKTPINSIPSKCPMPQKSPTFQAFFLLSMAKGVTAAK